MRDTDIPPKRACSRRTLKRGQLGWRTAPGAPLKRGRLLDESVAGIGLVVGDSEPLQPGQIIRVITPGTPLPRAARIVRVTRHGPRELRLGCRWHQQGRHAPDDPARIRLLDLARREHGKASSSNRAAADHINPRDSSPPSRKVAP